VHPCVEVGQTVRGLDQRERGAGGTGHTRLVVREGAALDEQEHLLVLGILRRQPRKALHREVEIAVQKLHFLEVRKIAVGQVHQVPALGPRHRLVGLHHGTGVLVVEDATAVDGCVLREVGRGDGGAKDGPREREEGEHHAAEDLGEAPVLGARRLEGVQDHGQLVLVEEAIAIRVELGNEVSGAGTEA